MTFQLTHDQEVKLVELAKNSERSTDELTQEAVAQFLTSQAEHRDKVERSRAQIAQGRTKSNEQVFSELKRRFGW
jgi:predicted transcriptional regulator